MLIDSVLRLFLAPGRDCPFPCERTGKDFASRGDSWEGLGGFGHFRGCEMCLGGTLNQCERERESERAIFLALTLTLTSGLTRGD